MKAEFEKIKERHTLISLNRESETLDRFGFKNFIYIGGYFGGHVTGIFICSLNADGSVRTNALKDDNVKKNLIVEDILEDNPNEENDDEMLDVILKDESIVKITARVAERDGDDVNMYIGYFLPYFVEGHSINEPTCNFEGDYLTYAKQNDIKSVDVYYEIMLVNAGHNAYKTLCLHFNEQDIESGEILTICDVINIATDKIIREMIDNSIILYDEIGRKMILSLEGEEFQSEDIARLIQSVRLLGVKYNIDIPNEELQKGDNNA